MNLRITTLTPTVVATGITYGKDEYFLRKEDGLFIRFNMEKLLSSPALSEFLARPENLGKLREGNLIKFSTFSKDKFKPFWLYSFRSPHTIEKYPVRECFKDSAGNPMIPGSSFKGAMRTALLWKYFEGKPHELTRAVREGLPSGGGSKFFLSDKFSNLFSRREIDVKGAPYKDIMRELLVGDFTYESGTPKISIEHIKRVKKDGIEVGKNNGIPTYVEAIPPGVSLKGVLSFAPGWRRRSMDSSPLFRELFHGLNEGEIINEIISIMHEFVLAHRHPENITDSAARIGFGKDFFYHSLLDIVRKDDYETYRRAVERFRIGAVPKKGVKYRFPEVFPSSFWETTKGKKLGFVRVEVV